MFKMVNKRLRNRKGFTLIELVMVIVILGILTAVAVPKFIDLRTEAQTAALHAWVRSRWPEGRVRAEAPVSCGNGDGQIFQGWIDLLVETPDGFVIIDHK